MKRMYYFKDLFLSLIKAKLKTGRIRCIKEKVSFNRSEKMILKAIYIYNKQFMNLSPLEKVNQGLDI
jgi:hypothetical protein